MNRGTFITFEGVEGSGKSTQSRLLCDALNKKGIETFLTREIGGTDAGEKLRDVILYNQLLPETELMLIIAARSEHIHKMILPALKAGKWVICDRYIDSTFCYQDLPINNKILYDLHQACIKDAIPDLTFFLDLPPYLGLERILERQKFQSKVSDKFETRSLSYHQDIYNKFEALSKKFSRIKTIKAEGLNETELLAKEIDILEKEGYFLFL